MKTLSRILLGLVGLALLLIVLLLGVVAYAGVTLTVRNRGTSQLQDVIVDYGRGRADVGTLRPGDEWNDDLGKIGEGANFLISFREQDEELQASFSVYFYGFNPRTQVVIAIRDHHDVRVWENGGSFARQTAMPISAKN